MKKNTTIVKTKRNIIIFIITLVIIEIGVIASFLSTNVKDFLIYYSISIIGVIIGKITYYSLKKYYDTRDNLE